MKPSRRVFYYGLPFVLACLLVGLLIYQKVTQSNHFSKDLEKLGHLPAFELMDQDGKAFTQKELEGKVNVINFMFTTCNGLCPTLNREMKKLEQHFSRIDAFSQVSISVDPLNDTPEQLSAWVKNHDIKTPKWSLLTGPRPKVKALLTDGLKVGLPDQPQAHSDRFVLIDRNNEIRGYYRLSDPDTLERLRVDIFSLIRG